MTIQELNEQVNRAASILKECGAQRVYVFGSMAAGTMHANSDIDMAVEGLPPAKFFSAMSRACQVLGRTLDLVDLDEVNPFTLHLKEKGKLVHVA